MKKIPIILIFLILSFSNFAQKYTTSAGVRVGTDFGISVQQKIFKNSTIEGIFQTNLGGKNDIMLTFLWEQHQKMIGKRINFYYGAGIHKGWIINNDPELNLKDPSGISLIAGLEMTFGRLNLSLDYKPVVNVISGDRFFESQSALSLRYVLIKSKKKKKRKKDGDWQFWKKDRN